MNEINYLKKYIGSLENQISSLTEYKNYLEEENKELRTNIKEESQKTPCKQSNFSDMEFENIILEFVQTEDPQRKECLRNEIIKMGLDPTIYDP